MKIKQSSFTKICAAIASKKNVPGGGVTVAMSGALAASLIDKVALFSLLKKNKAPSKRLKEIEKESRRLIAVFEDLADQDCQGYEAFTKEGKKAVTKIVNPPLEMARQAVKLLSMAKFLAENGYERMVADARCAQELAAATCYGALEMIRTNLVFIEDEQFEEKIKEEIEKLLDEAKSFT